MRYYVVDAFTDELFRGNPAGVCVLETFPPDDVMQSIASENNLSETAFVVPNGDEYNLRWFTPALEIDLCGHATLATAFILYRFDRPDAASLVFHTLSGPLTVGRDGDLLVMDFPTRSQERVAVTDDMRRAVGGADVLSAYAGYNLQLELVDEDAVRAVRPDAAAIRELDGRGLIVTAPGRDCDFVSRFFAPGLGVDEDPVTGSAHTSLVPYWAARLGKATLLARQVSPRGGTLWCTLAEPRVRIAGHACLYLSGELNQQN